MDPHLRFQPSTPTARSQNPLLYVILSELQVSPIPGAAEMHGWWKTNRMEDSCLYSSEKVTLWNRATKHPDDRGEGWREKLRVGHGVGALDIASYWNPLHETVKLFL